MVYVIIELGFSYGCFTSRDHTVKIIQGLAGTAIWGRVRCRTFCVGRAQIFNDVNISTLSTDCTVGGEPATIGYLRVSGEIQRMRANRVWTLIHG